jgi:hypothetical protein
VTHRYANRGAAQVCACSSRAGSLRLLCRCAHWPNRRGRHVNVGATRRRRRMSRAIWSKWNGVHTAVSRCKKTLAVIICRVNVDRNFVGRVATTGRWITWRAKIKIDS